MQSKDRTRIRLQFSKRLRSLRKEAGLTQFALAHRAEISLQYLQNLESQRPKNPSFETLHSLAKAMGMPLWKLLKFDE